MIRLFWTISAAVLLFPLSGMRAETADGSAPMRMVRRIALQKQTGRIDQVVPLADGQWAVRDADFLKPETQALEIYAKDGSFRGKVGEFGRGPGKYFRLRGLDVGADSSLWTADLARVGVFAPDGGPMRTILIQNPGYQINGLALDTQRGFMYLAGCLPLKTYLNDGCSLVHQYRLGESRLLRSFVETDPDALRNNWLPLQWYAIDLDRDGRVYLVDAPVHKLFRVNPSDGTTEEFPIRSLQMKALPYLFPVNTKSHEEAYREGFLLDRVAAGDGRTVVSVRRPRWDGYLLQIFDLEGRQIASDIEAPGRLVGKTRDGNFLFVKPGQFDILEYGF